MAAQLGEHVRQAVNGLRPENEVDERRTLGDAFAFLAGHAAADADDDLGSQGLQLAPAAEQRKDLFLGLFAHRAGIEQQQVGLGRVLGRLIAARHAQDVRHPGGVVLVHLAAEGFQVNAGHGGCYGRNGLFVQGRRFDYIGSELCNDL